MPSTECGWVCRIAGETGLARQRPPRSPPASGSVRRSAPQPESIITARCLSVRLLPSTRERLRGGTGCPAVRREAPAPLGEGTPPPARAEQEEGGQGSEPPRECTEFWFSLPAWQCDRGGHPRQFMSLSHPQAHVLIDGVGAAG